MSQTETTETDAPEEEAPAVPRVRPLADFPQAIRRHWRSAEMSKKVSRLDNLTGDALAYAEWLEDETTLDDDGVIVHVVSLPKATRPGSAGGWAAPNCGCGHTGRVVSLDLAAMWAIAETIEERNDVLDDLPVVPFGQADWPDALDHAVRVFGLDTATVPAEDDEE